MDFQSSQTIQLIKTFSEKGKSYLEEAAKEKNSSFYQNAIEVCHFHDVVVFVYTNIFYFYLFFLFYLYI